MHVPIHFGKQAKVEIFLGFCSATSNNQVLGIIIRCILSCGLRAAPVYISIGSLSQHLALGVVLASKVYTTFH